MEQKKVEQISAQKIVPNSQTQASKGSPVSIPAKPPVPPIPQRPIPTPPKQVQPQPVPQKQVAEPATKPIEKEKKTKQKKQKQPKEVLGEKEQQTKKKQKFLMYVGGSVVLAVIIITVLVILILNSFSGNQVLALDENARVDVYHFSNEYYIQATEDDEAVFYVFEIKKEGDESILIVQSSNVYNASYLLDERANFQIRYYIQKQDEKTRSEPSTWTNYVSQKQLQAPVIAFNEQDNTIDFSYIDYADFYRVYYWDKNQVQYFDYTPTPSQDDQGVAKVENTLPYGIYDVTVVAMPEETNEFYLISESSNALVISNYGQAQAINGATYSLSGQLLTIDASNLTEIATAFEIHVDNKQLSFTPTEKQDTYIIDLAANQMSVTLGMQVYVICKGDGNYILDSNQINAIALA